MARKGATAEQQTAALAPATAPSDAMELASALAEFDFGQDDGLSEADASDFKLPVVVWNMKGKKADGSLHQLNEYYNTLDETTARELRCAFIHLHKTNAFVRFDQTKNETEIVCSSADRQRGRLRVLHGGQPVGTERPCEKCPDAQWTKDAATGKNVRNCSEVYGVFAVLLDEQWRPTDGFLIRFKKTGLPPFRTHLQKHHLGRNVLPSGKRANVPLFAFPVRMTLEVDKSGNFAVPVIEKLHTDAPGGILPRPTLLALAEQAKFFAELGEEATKAAEKQEQKHEGGFVDAGASGGSNLRENDFAD